MNKYYLLSYLNSFINLILAICFIFFIDELNFNNVMYQYFLLYLLTLLLATLSEFDTLIITTFPPVTLL